MIKELENLKDATLDEKQHYKRMIIDIKADQEEKSIE